MMNVAASLLPCEGTLMVSSFVFGLNELRSVMTSSPSMRTVVRLVVGEISGGSGTHVHGIVVVIVVEVDLVATVAVVVELVATVVVAVELVVAVEVERGAGMNASTSSTVIMRSMTAMANVLPKPSNVTNSVPQLQMAT